MKVLEDAEIAKLQLAGLKCASFKPYSIALMHRHKVNYYIF